MTSGGVRLRLKNRRFPPLRRRLEETKRGDRACGLREAKGVEVKGGVSPGAAKLEAVSEVCEEEKSPLSCTSNSSDAEGGDDGDTSSARVSSNLNEQQSVGFNLQEDLSSGEASPSSLFCGVPFAEWNVLLHPRLRRTLTHHKYFHPTAIQQLAIATALHGHDTLIQSFTGSGKTLCLAVPLLQKVLLLSQRRKLERREGTRGIWISPTRELASQAASDVQKLCNLFPWLPVAAITGGAKRQSEKRQLRGGVGILVVTPGRLLDHLHSTSSLALRPLQMLLVDEADRLLESGYEQQVRSAVYAISARVAEEEQLQRLREDGRKKHQRQGDALNKSSGGRGELRGGGEEVAADSDDEEAQREELRRREKAFEGRGAFVEDENLKLPVSFQVVMASATLTPEVKRLANFCLQRSPQWVTQQPLELLESRMRKAQALIARQRQLTAPEKQTTFPKRGENHPSFEFTTPNAAILEEEEKLREAMLCQLCQCSLPKTTLNSKSPCIAVKGEVRSKDGKKEKDGLLQVQSLPSQLQQHFLLVSPRLRLLPLIAFLLKLEDSKTKAVLFASSCEVVDFLWLLLRRLRWPQRIPGDRLHRQRLLDLQKHVKQFNLQQRSQRMQLKKVQEAIGRSKQRTRKAAAETGGQKNDGTRRGAMESDEEDEEDGSCDEEEDEDEDDDLEGEPAGFWGERVFESLNVFRLHGRMNREDRIGCMEDFSALSGESGILLATDVAARGLNIPEVEWVLQLDAPQDVAVYVHRVGRTARLGRRGRSLLFLMNFEKDSPMSASSEYVSYLGVRGLKLAAAPSQPLLEFLVKRSPPFVAELRGGARKKGGGEEKKEKKEEDETFGELDPCLRFLQSSLCQFVAPRRRLREAASKAFVASISAYKTHSRDTVRIFNVRSLPFGHLATSFGLKDTPKQIAASVRKTREAVPAPAEQRGLAKKRQSQKGGPKGLTEKKRGKASFGKKPRKARQSPEDEGAIEVVSVSSDRNLKRSSSSSFSSAVERAASFLKAKGQVLQLGSAKKRKVFKNASG